MFNPVRAEEMAFAMSIFVAAADGQVFSSGLPDAQAALQERRSCQRFVAFLAAEAPERSSLRQAATSQATPLFRAIFAGLGARPQGRQSTLHRCARTGLLLPHGAYERGCARALVRHGSGGRGDNSSASRRGRSDRKDTPKLPWTAACRRLRQSRGSRCGGICGTNSGTSGRSAGATNLEQIDVALGRAQRGLRIRAARLKSAIHNVFASGLVRTQQQSAKNLVG